MEHNFTRYLNRLIAVVALVTGLSGVSFAQSTITLGTGTSSGYYSPFNDFYKNSWNEAIYTQAEMSAAAGCNITKIAFQSDASNSTTITATTLKIYMGERTSSDHSSTSDWTGAGALQLVYSGTNVTVGNVAAGSWQTFTLNTPFSYTGEGNLVVVVAKTTGTYNSSCVWRYSTVSNVSYPVLYRQNDSDASYATHPGSNTGTRYANRANTRFTYSNCCSVQRTGTFEFRNGSTAVTSVNYTMGQPLNLPTLVNNLTPAGTPTFSSSNTDIATVDPTTGQVTIANPAREGSTVISAYVPVSGSTCAKYVSYVLNVNDGCLNLSQGSSTLSSGPIYGYYENSYNQMLYTSAEIGNGGHITQIGFNAYSSNSQPRSVIVYMGETDQTTFTSGTNFVDPASLTEVYSGTWTITAGWNYFPVDFQYTGLHNLVIAIKSSATDYASTSFYYGTTASTSMAYVYSGTYDAIPSNFSSMSSGSTANRPNTKICIDACETQPNLQFSNTAAMCYLGSSCGLPYSTQSCGQLHFSSSNSAVASVDPTTGEITTHSMGQAVISVIQDTCQGYCPANASYELEVICPAQIPTAVSAWSCNGGPVELSASVNGEGTLQWFDAVDATTPIATGTTYTPNVSTTTTYYVGTYNTTYGCSSSRVPATAHVFEATYQDATLNISGYVGSTMYGYPPTGSHSGATFSASGMPAWLTLNSDGSFQGTPTAAGSGQFTITVTGTVNGATCTKQIVIHWTVAANNLSCCDIDGFYIFQTGKPFPIQQDAQGNYYADVCLGDPYTFSVTPRTTCSGYRYKWSLASSTNALIEETSNSTSSNYTHTFDRPTGYNLSVTISKTSSPTCSVTIPIRVRVAGVFQVATRPSFDLCKGEPFNIYVSSDGIGSIDVVRPQGGSQSTLGVSDTVFLPDGVVCNGSCSYVSSVTFTDFSAGARIRNANDLLYVKINMEHSYIGDFCIYLTCPNGTPVSIMNYSGNGSSSCSVPSEFTGWVGSSTETYCQFGDANDCSSGGFVGDYTTDKCDNTNGHNPPGIGWNYCWSQNTVRGYVYAASANSRVYETANHNSVATCDDAVDSSDMANMTQIYKPDGNFSDFVNCPLNGDWTITVIDGYSSDNGYIFNWELGLNEDLLPDSWSYSVDLDSAWTSCDWHTTKAGVYMEITPPANFVGTTTCDLFLRDEYGCTTEYENIATVTMHDAVHHSLTVTGECEPYTWARNHQTYTVSGTYIDNALTPEGCPDNDTLYLTISGNVLDTVDQQACVSYTWNGNTYNSSGQYNYSTTSAMGCDSTVTLNLEILPSLTTTHDTTICNESFPITFYGHVFNSAGTQTFPLTTAGGCDSTVTLTVNAYNQMTVSLNLPADGCPLPIGNYSVTANINNGATPYTYNWTGAYVGSASVATIPSTGTCATFNLNLTVTDAHGCVATTNGSFGAIDDEGPYFNNPSVTSVPAEFGSELYGEPCVYLVPNIIALLDPQDNCGIQSQEQSPRAGSATSGSVPVEVTVRDHCGHVLTKTVQVTVPDNITAQIASTGVACNGGNNGTVTVSNVQGGTTPYTYSWTYTDLDNNTTTLSENTAALTGRPAGRYTVTISDANNCSYTTYADVSQAGTLVATIAQDSVSCNGYSTGTITLTSVSGGTFPYHYTWPSGITAGDRDSIATGVAAGTYSVLITDDEGCTTTKTITVLEPAAIVVTVDNFSNLTCYNNGTGSITVSATGGNGGYNYNWTNGMTGQTINGLDANVSYTVNVTDSKGCPGTVSKTLTQPNELTATAFANPITICNGASATITAEGQQGTVGTGYRYEWTDGAQGATRTVTPTSTTTYYVTVYDANNCSAQANTTVNVNQPTTSIETETACDRFTWHGTTYTASTNTPTYQTTNAAGCDSTVTLHLTINNSTTSVEEQEACETYNWHGTDYTTSTNTPIYISTNAAGCPDTVNLHLTIHYNEYTSTTAEACETYTWNIRGQSFTYTTSNTYYNRYNIQGCEGVDTLHLTIHHSTTGVDNQEACDSYQWGYNHQTYTSSTTTPTYTIAGVNQWGCDSIVNLHLTIKRSTLGIDTHNECDSYTWLNGITYTTSQTGTNAPTIDAGTNAAGCDSTLRLNLVIRRSTTAVFTDRACDSYTWHGNTYTSSTNAPTYQTTNAAGCDSTVTLHLTINYSRQSEHTDTVCYGASLNYAGGSYPAGDYTIHRTTTAGCDSTITLHVIQRPQIRATLSEFHSCELGHYELTGDVIGGNRFRWSSTPNDATLNGQQGELMIAVNPRTTTTYTLTGGYGPNMLCSNAASLTLEPLNLPVADMRFQPEFLTCDDLHWTVYNASTNTESVSWYVNGIYAGTDESISGDANCADDSIMITINAVNGICNSIKDSVIYVRKSGLYVPNIFTPNLNINKTFNAIGRGILEYEMYIYTREGLLVFHSTSLEDGWKGDHEGVECPRAAYTYIIRYRTEVEPDRWVKKVGTVLLLR